MKTRRFFLGLVLVVLVSAIWLLCNRQHREPAQQRLATANPASEREQQPSVSQPTGRRPQTSGASAEPQGRAVFATNYDYVTAKTLDPQYDWKQSINFYGQVVDESSQPVPGADVSFRWNSLSETGSSESGTQSDGRGLFSLTDQKGKRLYVQVSKEGYYTSRGDRIAFEYANPYDGLFTPDPNTPVIFHLRKKGQTEPLVVMRSTLNEPGIGKKFALSTNGAPVAIDLLRGKSVEAGGEVEVQCWIVNENGKFNEPYVWKYRISVPGGGIRSATNEFNFEAPVEDYQTDITDEVHPDLDRAWSNKNERGFFLRLSDGKYAWMKFTIYAGRTPFCLIESFVNPSGSRNLELDPDKIIIAQ